MPGELDLAAEALRNAARAVPVETLSSVVRQLPAVAEYVQQTGGTLAEPLLRSIAASRADGAGLLQRLEAFRQDLETAAVGVAAIGGGATAAPPSGATNRPGPAATPPAPPAPRSKGLTRA